MKEIVFLSGKGGTGKTSLTAAFSHIAKDIVLCDADVDAPDLHLILNPKIKYSEDFTGGSRAKIDEKKCIRCGKCIDLCRFDAVSDDFRIDEFSCEGCGVCVDNCDEKAVFLTPSLSGKWYISDTARGKMVHASLGTAEENSGKLVSLIRGEARKIASSTGKNFILTDGSPGIGCPVIASVSGADAIVIITEPTVSGLHDMERVLKLADHFKVPSFIIVNRYDINIEFSKLIEERSRSLGAVLLGKIPFHGIFIEAVKNGKTVFEVEGGDMVKKTIESIWEKIFRSV